MRCRGCARLSLKSDVGAVRVVSTHKKSCWVNENSMMVTSKLDLFEGGKFTDFLRFLVYICLSVWFGLSKTINIMPKMCTMFCLVVHILIPCVVWLETSAAENVQPCKMLRPIVSETVMPVAGLSMHNPSHFSLGSQRIEYQKHPGNLNSLTLHS